MFDRRRPSLLQSLFYLTLLLFSSACGDDLSGSGFSLTVDMGGEIEPNDPLITTEPLSISSITPGQGPAAGGTLVAIRGTSFREGVSVFFGTSPATDVNIVSPSFLTAIVPAGEVGVVDIKISSSDEEASLINAFRYETREALQLFSIQPREGSITGGVTAILRGEGFKPGMEVRFGNTLAENIELSSENIATCLVPSGVAGVVDVTVSLSEDQEVTLSDYWSYIDDQTMRILALRPNVGPSVGRDLVMVTGEGFEPNMTARFDDLPAEILEVPSSEVLLLLTPSHPGGSASLTLTRADELSVTLEEAFTFENTVIETQALTISQIEPRVSPEEGGTPVLITGTGFDEDTVVMFGDTEAETIYVDDEHLIAIAPAGDGEVAIGVVNTDGSSTTLAGAFDYSEPVLPGPVLTGLTPNVGPVTGHSRISLEGEGFFDGAYVLFGIHQATEVEYISESEIVITSPNGNLGSIDVTVINPDGQFSVLSDGYSYFNADQLEQAPTVAAVTPASGWVGGGEEVLITGNRFGRDPTVYFGSAQAEVLSVSNQSLLRVRTPTNYQGVSSITVTTERGLSGVLNQGFLYFEYPPSLFEVDPQQGPLLGGREVTLMGANLQEGARVRVDGVVAQSTFISREEIRFIPPPHHIGLVDIEVTNPDGLSAWLRGAYEYIVPPTPEAPVVLSVSPSSTLSVGGEIAVIRGDYFSEGAKVYFGEHLATDIMIYNPQLITAIIPAGEAQTTVDLLVRNSDDQEGLLEDAFSYSLAERIPDLAVSAINPAQGSTQGGDTISIVGAGFIPGMSVFFGLQEASNVQYVNPSMITVTTPQAEPGLSDIIVRRLDNQQVILAGAFLYLSEQTSSLSLTQIQPSVGPVSGGTRVIIRGRGFTESTVVSFGDVLGSQIQVNSSEEITAVSPARSVGTVSVSAHDQSTNARAILAGAFTYFTAEASSAPQIFSVQPYQGSLLGGEEVVINGQNFQAGARVLICGLASSTLSVQANTVTVRTPRGVLGMCDVELVNPDGQMGSQVDAFRYIAPLPILSAVIPSQGSVQGGTNVLIQGDHFIEGVTVNFGPDPAASVTLWDQQTIVAVSPAAPSGIVDIRVTNPGGLRAVLSQAFTFVNHQDSQQAPSIEGISPRRGPLAGGTPVEVFGSNFMEGLTLKLGDSVIENLNLINDGHLVFVTPAGSIGMKSITVINPTGLGVSVPDLFEYTLDETRVPRLIGVVPASGPRQGGQAITISGDQFESDGVFYLGTKRLNNLTVISENVATGFTPLGDQAGVVNLRYVSPAGSYAELAESYTYVDAPTLDSIGPVFGAQVGGTEVVLIGASFQRGVRVLLGGTEVDLVSFVNPNRLVITTPAHAPGFADIRVINPDGQIALLESAYEYLAPPQITSLSQRTGPEGGGTIVRLTGVGFVPGTIVTFGPTVAQETDILSSEEIYLKTPAHVAGAVNVTTRNPDGQESIFPQGFTYVAGFNLDDRPTLSEVFPTQGPATGGAKTLITGNGFTRSSKVFFDRELATDVRYLSDKLLEVITPAALEPGNVFVAVMNLDGQVSEAQVGYTYFSQAPLIDLPLEITGVSPNSGPVSGDTEVTLNGRGITEPIRVLFDHMLVDEVSVVSGESLVAISPPSEPKNTSISVYDNLGQVVRLESAFLYIPPPQLTSVEPNQSSVSGGVIVTLTGSDLAHSGGVQVLICENFDSREGCITVDETTVNESGTELTFTTPEGADGVFDIAVVNPDDQVDVIHQAITYNPTPIVATIQPQSGSTRGGERITVTGENFQNGARVFIGDALCGQVNVLSEEALSCTSGQASAGLSSVRVENPDLGSFTLETSFIYILPPTIESISPSSAAEVGGARVTITGSGFVATSEVSFGQNVVPAENTQVISDGVISLTTPPGVGLVAVSIRNPDGQTTTRNNAFTYIPPALPPLISNTIPRRSEQQGGQVIQVIGANFLEGAQVFFGKDPEWFEAEVISVQNQGTLIKAYSPPVLEAGIVDILVRNSDGQEAIYSDEFEYTEDRVRIPLGFESAMPSTAILSGGSLVTLSGQGFINGAQVFFGKEPEWRLATSIEWFGPTVMRVEVPESYNGLSGRVDIKIVNPPILGVDEYIAEDIFEYTNDAVLHLSDGTKIWPEDHSDQGSILGDFTGDGHNDVLVFRNGNFRLQVNTPLNGIEIGAFQPRHIDFSHNVRRADKGDIDGDGDLDVVLMVNNSSGSYPDVFVCYNNGAGFFESCSHKYRFPSQCDDRSVIDVKLVDLSCDGALDIFASVMSLSSSCPNTLLLNDGTGKSFLSVNKLPEHFEDTRTAAFGDIDLDGDTDILLANDNAMQNRLYLNNCANNPGVVDFSCPYNGGNCREIGEAFEGKQYLWCDQAQVTNTAHSICELHHGAMVTPNTLEEMAYLRSLVGNQYIMVGWTDEAEEGVWQSKANNEEQPIWCGSEPDGGRNENFVRWYMGYNCVQSVGNESRYFFCERTNEVNCDPYDQWMFTDAQPGVNFPISGGNTRDVALVDLNQDGFLDAVIGNSDQRKNVFINDGGNFLIDDGQYWPQQEAVVDTAVDGLIPTDIDLDGDIDMILYSPDRVRIYQNDYNEGGIGALTEVTEERLNGFNNLDGTVSYNVRGDDVGISVGDLDGDLLPDIYIVNNYYTDRLLMNAGYDENDSWEEENRVPAGYFEYNTFKEIADLSITSRETELVDYDNDGDLDIVKCTSIGIRTYDNLGGRFVDKTSERMPNHQFNCADRGLEVVDVTGDNSPDIMALSVYNEPGNLFQFVNDGSGHFTNQNDRNIPRVNDYWTSLTAIDMELDQDYDFLMGAYYQYYTYSKFFLNGGDVFNTGGSYFFDLTCTYLSCSAPCCSTQPTGNVRTMKVDRINDDIWSDLYVVRNGQNQIFFNSGEVSPMLNGTLDYLPALSDNSYDAALIDADLDGDTDIYVANYGQDRFLVRESADKFSDITASSLPNSDLVRRNSRAVDVADFNGDGLPEILLANYEQGNVMLSNTGANTFLAKENTLPFDLSRTVDVDIFDFDGDGDLDAYITNIGQDYIYINRLIDEQ